MQLKFNPFDNSHTTTDNVDYDNNMLPNIDNISLHANTTFQMMFRVTYQIVIITYFLF